MENTTEKKAPARDKGYVIVGGEKYWKSYQEARMRPVRYRDGCIYRWVGARDGTFVELRT